MRTLLAKKYNTCFAEQPDDDAECLTDLFGSAKKGRVKTSRILFSDMFLSNWEELKKQGAVSKTEIKFENSIKHTTAVANPRQIERVIRASKFLLDLIYGVKDEETMKQDFCILKDGFKLFEYDYLGGNGSRGYGKIKFWDLQIDVVIGEVPEECRKLLSEV